MKPITKLKDAVEDAPLVDASLSIVSNLLIVGGGGGLLELGIIIMCSFIIGSKDDVGRRTSRDKGLGEALGADLKYRPTCEVVIASPCVVFST